MSDTNGIIDIDHLMVNVASLSGAAERFERLGFFVCPPRKRIGMAAFRDGKEGPDEAPKSTLNNRHIIFKPNHGHTDVANFVEFMCNDDPLSTPPKVMQMMAFLGDSEGPKTIVCMTADLDRTIKAFRARGFDIPATIPFETGWDDVERGTFVRIQARPFVPSYGQFPFHMNCFETSTVENYQYTPWTEHPNGVRCIVGVTGISNDVKRDAMFMGSQVFDVEPRWSNEHEAILQPRDVWLRILDIAGFEANYPGLTYSLERLIPHTLGLTFAVEDISSLTTIWKKNGVQWVKTPAGVCIPRENACNTLLEFVELDRSSSASPAT